MYKVRDIQTGQDINILSPLWYKQNTILHSLDQQDRLVCPGCLHPMRVRTGVFKRWHFAHKHLQNCPFEHESPLLLKTRAILYKWLVDQFDEHKVTIEKKFDALNLPHPVDCWIENDQGSLAFWIFDTRLPPDEREVLQKCFSQLSVLVNWVFVAEMLHEDEIELNRIHLTTTEREFMRSTACDEAMKRLAFTPGKTLHYLDADRSTLTTYRNLRLIHKPQLFSGNPRRNLLATIYVSPYSGELLHPGDSERILPSPNQRLTPDEVQSLGFPPKSKDSPTCLICGQKTTDYWYHNRSNNTCKCRACFQQGKY